MYKVEGYEFETKEQAKLAQKEAAKVRYIKDQTSMDDPDVVLQLYNSLILKEAGDARGFCDSGGTGVSPGIAGIPEYDSVY